MSGPGHDFNQLQSVLGSETCKVICENPKIADEVRKLVARLTASHEHADMNSALFPGKGSSVNTSPSAQFLGLINDDLRLICSRIPIAETSKGPLLIAIGLDSRAGKWARLAATPGQMDFFSTLLNEAQDFSIPQLRKLFLELRDRSFNQEDKKKLAGYADHIPTV